MNEKFLKHNWLRYLHILLWKNNKTHKLLDSWIKTLKLKQFKLWQITNSMTSTFSTIATTVMLVEFTFLTTSELTYWLKEECDVKHVNYSVKCDELFLLHLVVSKI